MSFATNSEWKFDENMTDINISRANGEPSISSHGLQDSIGPQHDVYKLPSVYFRIQANSPAGFQGPAMSTKGNELPLHTNPGKMLALAAINRGLNITCSITGSCQG